MFSRATRGGTARSVIAVMALLAALAMGASLIADARRTGLAVGVAAIGEMTVQILTSGDRRCTRRVAAQVQAALENPERHAGASPCRAMSDCRYRGLGRTWIGKNNLVAEISTAPAEDVHHSRRARGTWPR